MPSPASDYPCYTPTRPGTRGHATYDLQEYSQSGSTRQSPYTNSGFTQLDRRLMHLNRDCSRSACGFSREDNVRHGGRPVQGRWAGDASALDGSNRGGAHLGALTAGTVLC